MRKTFVYSMLVAIWVALLCLGESMADVTVSESQVQKAVETYVRDLLNDFPGEIEVMPRRSRPVTVSGTGRVSLQVVPAPRRGSARAIPVLVEFVRGPVVIDTVPVMASVRYFDQVLVAARPIQRGEPLEAEAVNLERREVTAHLGRYVSNTEDLNGKRAKMRIGFGRTIDPRYIESIPTVSKGDFVRIEVQLSGVSASAEGIASESGVTGDLIVVKNVASREKLTAEVIGPGRVRIAL